MDEKEKEVKGKGKVELVHSSTFIGMTMGRGKPVTRPNPLLLGAGLVVFFLRSGRV